MSEETPTKWSEPNPHCGPWCAEDNYSSGIGCFITILDVNGHPVASNSGNGMRERMDMRLAAEAPAMVRAIQGALDILRGQPGPYQLIAAETALEGALHRATYAITERPRSVASVMQSPPGPLEAGCIKTTPRRIQPEDVGLTRCLLCSDDCAFGAHEFNEGNPFCPDCRGRGYVSAKPARGGPANCAHCGGSGRFDGHEGTWQSCEFCGGSGKAPSAIID